VVVPADTSLPLQKTTHDFVLAQDVSGNCLELEIEFAPGQTKQFGVKICCSPDGEEQTPVFYDTIDKALKIDTRHASLGEGPKTVASAPLKLNGDEPLKLRVFVDRSVVEIFANNRQAAMRRIYPTRGDARSVLLFAKGSSATITSLRAWDMVETNPW
jgi:beta-fructofuranosidase